MNQAIPNSIQRLHLYRQALKDATNQLKALRIYLKSEIGTRSIARQTPRQELLDLEKHTQEKTIQILTRIINDLGVAEHFGITNNELNKCTKTKSAELHI